MIPGTVHPLMNSGGIPPALAYGNFVWQPTGAAAPSFAGVTFPLNPSASRRVVVCIIGFGPPTGVASAVTIGGIAATIHTNTRQAAGTILTIASAVVPTGSSGTVQITYPSATSNAGAFCWSYAVDGMQSGTPQAFTDVATPFTIADSWSANSAFIALGTWYQDGAVANADSWTNIRKDDGRASGGLAGAGSVASGFATSAGSGSQTYTPPTTNAAGMHLVIFT